MEEPKLRLLFTSLEAKGHINAAVGVADLFKSKGHHVIFALREGMRSLVEGHGFEFRPLSEKFFSPNMDALTGITKVLAKSSRKDPLERGRCMSDEEIAIFNGAIDGSHGLEYAVDELMKQNDDFDVVVIDYPWPSPILHNATRPYVVIYSANPLPIYKTPLVVGGGFSAGDIGSPELEEYRRSLERIFEPTNRRKREQLIAAGMKERADEMDMNGFLDRPKYLGIYHYPEDIDYVELGTRRENWMRIDSFVRKPTSLFEVPEKLRDKTGKLGYFSLGSSACMDIQVMQQLLDAMSKTSHRFIVSTGPLGDDVKLYDNMWGDKYLDQVAVLEKVNFAILHGGNNGFMEALHCGKPMIVVPYFFDQIDNAKRAEDKGIGKQILIWDYDEEKFLAAIEEVANNEEMKEKVEKISQNMRNSRSGDDAIRAIENIVANAKNNNDK